MWWCPMFSICDNPKCRDHVPLPAGLREDAPYVRVMDPLPEFVAVRPGSAMPANDVMSRLVARVLYCGPGGYPRYYLCDVCHDERQRASPG